MTATTTTPVDVDHPLDLVNEAMAGMTEDERHQFANYLVGALTAGMAIDDVAAAITAARQCCDLINNR